MLQRVRSFLRTVKKGISKPAIFTAIVIIAIVILVLILLYLFTPLYP